MMNSIFEAYCCNTSLKIWLLKVIPISILILSSLGGCMCCAYGKWHWIHTFNSDSIWMSIRYLASASYVHCLYKNKAISMIKLFSLIIVISYFSIIYSKESLALLAILIYSEFDLCFHQNLYYCHLNNLIWSRYGT